MGFDHLCIFKEGRSKPATVTLKGIVIRHLRGRLWCHLYLLFVQSMLWVTTNVLLGQMMVMHMALFPVALLEGLDLLHDLNGELCGLQL